MLEKYFTNNNYRIEKTEVMDIDVIDSLSVVEAFEKYKYAELSLDALESLNADVKIGYEYFVNNLITLGVDKDEVKNITAGLEANDMSFFQKLKIKIITAARKAWEFIKDLINKVFDFFKKIFNKRIDYAHKAKEIIDNLKKQNKTELNKIEFDDDVKNNLLKALPTQAMIYGIINANSLTDYVTVLKDKFELEKFDKMVVYLEILNNILIKDAEKFKSIFGNLKQKEEVINLWLNGLIRSDLENTVIKVLNDYLENEISIPDYLKDFKNIVSQQLMANDVKEGDKGVLEVVGIRDNSITITVIKVVDEKKLNTLIEKLRNFDSAKMNTIKEKGLNGDAILETVITSLNVLLKDIKNLVQVKIITIFTDNFKVNADAAPSKFTDLENFVNEYISATEAAFKYLEESKKKLKEFDKALGYIKDFDKFMNAISKFLAKQYKNSNLFTAGNIFMTLFTISEDFIGKPFRKNVSLLNNTAYGLIKSNMYQYVVECSKMYETPLQPGLPKPE